jgi:hypothetical protein
MKTSGLSTMLQKILALTVPIAGCGGIDTSAFEQVPCTSEFAPDYLNGLALDPTAGYLELRKRGESTGVPDQVTATAGTPCLGARDVPACEVAIAAVTSPSGFQLGQCVQVCDESYLIINRGDEMTVVGTREAMLELLGPVDSAAEAVFAAALRGYSIRCDDPDGGVRAANGGFEVLGTKVTSGCEPVETTQYLLSIDASGQIIELETDVIDSSSGCIGRRPAGLCRARGRRASALGAHFANAAELEAASVHAFAALHRELAHHGAPARLLDASRAALRDEVRHAALARRLARRYGAEPKAPRVEAQPIRSLVEIAIENAAEGCVRETFGVLVGRWQARFARDPVVRRTMAALARDETRHAELAFEVDAWLRGRLSPSARRRVDRARARALAELGDEVKVEPRPELVAWAGLPGAAEASELARRFAEAAFG